MPSASLRCRGRHRPLLGAAAALVTALGATPARAQGRYQSALLGGRSALLGGTGVVLGVDGAAPFLNPATIVRIEDRDLAFSSRFFRYAQRTLHAWHQPGPVDEAQYGALRLDNTSVTDRSLSSVPDTTCYFIDLKEGRRDRESARAPSGRQMLAACIAETEENEFGFDALGFSEASSASRVNQTQTVRYAWSRWSAGPSFGYSASDRLALGASLSLVRTHYSSSLSVSSLVEDAGSGAAIGAMYQSALSGDSWDVLAHLGATLRLTRVLSAGISVRTPSVHVLDTLDAGISEAHTTGAAAVRTWAGEGEFVAPSPARVAAGVSAEWSRLRLELNGFFYLGQSALVRADIDREDVVVQEGSTVSRQRSRLTLAERAEPVANVGLGAELFLTQNLSLVGGVLTDFSAVPEMRGAVSAESRLFLERMSGVHAALGMVSYTQYGDLVFGARFGYAAGEMVAINAFTSPVRLHAVDCDEIGLTLVLAGRISLRTVERAARALEDAVDGSAGGPPERGAPREPMRTPPREE